jgi:hypothetical protein
MQRRKYLAAIGSMAAAGAAGMGTGAFTTTSSGERAVDVNVASDSSSFLTIKPSSSPNGGYAEETSGTLELNFDETNDTGSGTLFKGEGINPGSVYTFDNVFIINNQGDAEIDVWLTKSGLSGVQFYQSGDPSDRLEKPLWSAGGTKTNLNISQKGVEVGVKIIADELDTGTLGEISGSVVIHAGASPASIRND